MLVSSVKMEAFASEQERGALTGKEQVRLCEVIGTAYVADDGDGEGMAVMGRSAVGSYATISKVRVIKYANYYTNIFRVQTETGSWTGYCAEPRRKAMPGVYSVSILHDDTIKRLLLTGPEGPYYDQVRDGLFAGLTWDTAFADTHAAIGYVYSGDTTGMDAGYLDGIKNQIACVRSGWVGDILEGVVDQYTVYIAYNDAGQDIVWLEYNPRGTLTLRKVSENPDMTGGNSCYSLAGAVYGVYSDENCTNQVGALTTAESGSTGTMALEEGTYYVKEQSPSRGYRIDEKIYPVTVTGGNTSTLCVTEKPGSDPTVITLQKVDQDTGAGSQGGASLGGARFTIGYYDGYYTKDTLPSSPVRSWVIETREERDPLTGRPVFCAKLSEGYKVSGDAFFRDSDGTIVMPLGTVSIEETKAPTGYQKEGVCFQVEGSLEQVKELYVAQVTEEEGVVRLMGGSAFTVGDPVIRGGVSIRKLDYDTGEVPQGDATLAGARIEIVNDNERDVVVDGVVYRPGEVVCSGVTGNDGVFRTTNYFLPYGAYCFREIDPPEGYLLEGVLEGTFRIEKNGVNVYCTTLETALRDYVVKCPVVIKKVSDDGTDDKPPLAGAGFCLFPASTAGRYSDMIALTEDGGKVIYTDENGYAKTVPIPYGTYILREYFAPVGHQRMEDQKVLITGETAEVALTVENVRKPGSITIVKKDDRGYPVENIEFTLYDETDHIVAVQRTDVYGGIRLEGLTWGTYYLEETDAPDYYAMDKEKHEIILSAADLDKTMEIVNETVKGTVVFTKTDESGSVALSGAEYVLYANDGTRVGTYMTDRDGRICVEGLAWGSYYFKETKPPLGYGLSGESIRFSVNAMNAGIIQQIHAADPPEARSLTLTKRIVADDINFANGTPSFIFCVSGTDINGIFHEYYRIVTFDEGCVSTDTDSDGYVSRSVVFPEMTAGMYEAREMEVSRYVLENVSNISENGRICRDGSDWYTSFNLIDYSEGHATYVNRRYEHRNYSDSQCVINVLKKTAALTALKVEYGTERVEAGDPVRTDLLTVTAIYDDGTWKEISQESYRLSARLFPNVSGAYTVEVSYTEGGVTRTGNFTVTLYCPPKLEDSHTFNLHIKRLYPSATAIVFTDETAPSGVVLTDVSAAKNKGVVAWTSKGLSADGIVYISTQIKGEKIMANGFYEGYVGEKSMFEDLSDLRSIDASNLDVSNMKSMARMFKNCSKLMSLNMEGWDMSNVYDMREMFSGCKRLFLDCRAWDVSNVKAYSNFNLNATRVKAPVWVN